MFKTGLQALDKALFDGEGVPPGTLIELYGTQDSGKTALALWFCRSFQEISDEPVGWICAETNISTRNMVWAGVDPHMLVVRQSFAMPGLQAAQLLLQEGCKLIVLDSIAALVTEVSTTPLTQLISADLYKVKCLAIEQNALVILTNQERSRPPGRATSRAGACPALNRLIDCQIRLETGQGLYRGGIQVGIRIHFKITKNGSNFDNWDRTGRLNISYDTGLKDLRNES
jgi:RecA/RadA recombinase